MWEQIKNFFKFAAENEKVQTIKEKYQQSEVGKLDKELDEKYEAWLDTLFK